MTPRPRRAAGVATGPRPRHGARTTGRRRTRHARRRGRAPSGSRSTLRPVTIFGVSWDALSLDAVRGFLVDADDEPLLWEAKGTRIDKNAVRQQVCGFANSHEGGYLILGADRESDGWSLEGCDSRTNQSRGFPTSSVMPNAGCTRCRISRSRPGRRREGMWRSCASAPRRCRRASPTEPSTRGCRARPPAGAPCGDLRSGSGAYRAVRRPSLLVRASNWS